MGKNLTIVKIFIGGKVTDCKYSGVYWDRGGPGGGYGKESCKGKGPGPRTGPDPRNKKEKEIEYAYYFPDGFVMD